MASGYEKSDCGVDVERGWGQPTCLENRIQFLVAVTGLVLWIGVLGAVILRMIRWLTG
ncbi:hypothetical protein [Paracoccus jeotgali]|uniref:hypothetical protein n=1 Tax=Paracoccus jeotgali TaxID=2065379 RepID=UPI001315534A|nr:hypothetical protein [Paracoccus jeotgali]